ncbi:MAG TPA: HAMP domain-containing sensor histidine kinase [bacterium]|nr:HAMP domain-containing sensor histidine kinase [bacterium]
MKASWSSLSLRARLIAGAVSVIVALTVVYSVLVFERVRQAHDVEIEKRCQAVAEQLGTMAELPIRAGDLAALDQIARDALRQAEIVAVEFKSLDTGKTARAERSGQAAAARVYSYTLSIVPETFSDEIGILEGAGEGKAGKAVGEVKVTISLAGSDRVMARIQAAMIVAALVLMTIAILINVQIARRITDPLMALAQGARKIGEGRFDERIDTTGGGEVGAVAEQFNRMAENLKTTLDQMIQQEKMASLGRMASGITHEIGNPLNSILLDVTMLMDDLPQGPNREKAAAIQAQARRMKEIVNHLLDYAHTPPTQMQSVDVSEALDDAIRVLSHPLAKSGLVIKRELPPDLPRVMAIKTMCVQVFVNLIINAIEATGKNGGLQVAAELGTDPERLLVSFSDTGPGIPEEFIEHVFDPFFTTKQKGQGTGLGLSICRQIMRGFGGEIRAEKSVGGAKFIIEFQCIT